MAFHRYPQLIPRFFNNGGFGPPRNFTSVSSCPWIGHLVSGLQHDTHTPYSDSVSLRLRTLKVLNLASYRNSPVRSAKSTRSHFNVLPPVVNIGFQVLFHSPPGCFSPFPHGTSPLSVTREYLALGGGPPCFTQDSSCPVLLWSLHSQLPAFAYRTVTFSGPAFQPVRLAFRQPVVQVRNPGKA